ncbi:MAG: TetR/AcrR family transcriptional regulator [Candidatus Marivariicella sp.]|tara:strand:+ start:2827 stop:3396 length:570 start_codon:yes stop_codon:yes gene_type:complete
MKKASSQILFSTAKNLFFKFGLRRVSVEEICNKASVSKMTFYRNFNNKEHIAIIILKDFLDESLKVYKNIMSKKISFSKKVENLILNDKNYIEKLGPEFISDVYNYKTTMFSNLLEKSDALFYAELRNDFTQAQNNGDLRKETPVDFYLHMMDSIKEKMNDQALKKLYKDEKVMLMDLTNFFFYGIMAK